MAAKYLQIIRMRRGGEEGYHVIEEKVKKASRDDKVHEAQLWLPRQGWIEGVGPVHGIPRVHDGHTRCLVDVTIVEQLGDVDRLDANKREGSGKKAGEQKKTRRKNRACNFTKRTKVKRIE